MNKTTAAFDLAELNNRHRWQQRPPKVFPSPWACEWGFDQYGLWQSFIVKGIRHKMRFIPAGEFLMGSPESEADRYDDEAQHPVTISQGFWLGETTISQQLWQAVMDNNPSHFKPEKSECLPVESVSWDDCQLFCDKLNALVPVLTLSLPTEEQWEYACRAGSQTPFSTGQQLTTAQANYNGNQPYHKGEKGVYRKKTVDVNRFTPNDWGLYQMHGNVLEWCLDVWRKNLTLTDVDSVDGEAPERVLRGGSWFVFGQFCRSACRNYRQRGNAFNIGLRVTQVEPADERAAPADPIRSGARAGKGEASGD